MEYVAAQVFLDEEHERPSFASPNDNNDYALGKVAEHNAVIAVLPDGDYDTASAANVATNMLSTFYNVRILTVYPHLSQTALITQSHRSSVKGRHLRSIHIHPSHHLNII